MRGDVSDAGNQMRGRILFVGVKYPLLAAATVLMLFSAMPSRADLNPSPLNAPIAAEKPLYLNPDAPLDDRVRDLIGRLTIEEKGILLDHDGPTIERLGIRSDKWNQCLHGVSWDGGPTTLFPIPTAMAATWDPQLVHGVADAISDEARAINNAWHIDPDFRGTKKGLIYRAPVINILRNPYWGRDGEAWSEDPFLCGRMAVAFVEGLQGDDPHYLKLAATLKHYAVNNVESDRQKLNAIVPERMLYEYWLPHFRDAVVEGGAASVMASYNAINGTPNNINHWLLTEVLKGEWHHEGFVVSDLGGVQTMVSGHEKGRMGIEEAVAKSLMAGCDFSDKEFRLNIPGAVKDGLLSEARLDDALARVLKVRFRLGEFDPADRVPYRKIPMSVVDSPEHRAISLRASRESIVLLRNEGDLLPLDRTKVKRIAVVGPLAGEFVAGDPNYIGSFKRDVVDIVCGFRDRAPACEVMTATGAEVAPEDRSFDKAGELRKAVDAARGADVAIVCVGTTLAIEREGLDRQTLALPGNQEELVEAVYAANPRTIVVLINAGPLTVPWIKEHIPAILAAWHSGEEQGHAVADVIFGDVNPAGRLPYTVYSSESQVPLRDEYDISKGYTYMYLRGEPLFAFGYGLSYTRFRYTNLTLSSNEIAPDGDVTVRVEVENTGGRDGDEVVQLYTHAVKPSVVRPSKELRGFLRISLKAGEKKAVSFSLRAGKLAFYDEATHAFRVEPGEYEIMVGASSADIRGVGRLKVAGEAGLK
jgi:beta-glucosidase